MLKESVKCVPRKFQIKFQEFSRMFFQFCCCMDLIAATRAEGGLVLYVTLRSSKKDFGQGMRLSFGMLTALTNIRSTKVL